MDEKYSPKGERKRDNFYLSLGRKRKKDSGNKAPQPRLRLRLSDFYPKKQQSFKSKKAHRFRQASLQTTADLGETLHQRLYASINDDWWDFL